MKKYRNALIGSLGGVVVGTGGLAVAMANAGAGHGSYAAAKILFPYTMFLGMAFAGSITASLGGLAILEFPLYGFALGWAASRGQTKRTVYCILLLHASAWLLCLSVKADF